MKKNVALTSLIFFLACLAKINAQTTSSGDIDFGFYQISGYTLSNKYLEYKDYREGIVINGLSYYLGSKIGFLDLKAKGIAKRDQSSNLRMGKYGRYYLEASWDQIPHVFSNHSRLFLNETQKGVYTISDSIQAHLQRITNNDSMRIAIANYLSQAQRFPLSYRRDKAVGEIKVSPTRNIDLQLSYSNEKKAGYKATNTTNGTPGGFNVIELPEPIDYITQNVAARVQYAQKDWSVRADIGLSVFDNRVESMIWDNTTRLTDTTGGTIRTSKGRIGVAPDNWALNNSVSGFVKLPHNIKTRATLGFGLAKQDEDFLPHTINTAITDPTSQLVLPQSSLDGEIRTLIGNYWVGYQPIKQVSIEGNFNYYEFDNQTEEIIFPGYVADGDHLLDTMGRASIPYEYIRRNFGVKANLKPISYISTGISFKRERFSRDHRNVHRSNENIFGFSLDLFPVSWITLRNSYTRAERKAEDYEPDAVDESFPEGEATASPHLEKLRRFDQADRDRDKIVSQASLELSGYADLILQANLNFDDYAKSESSGIDTLYGLKESRATALSAGLNFYPLTRLTLFLDYTREFLFSELHSRLRNVVGGTGTDSVQNDWGTKIKDLTDIFSLGFLVDIFPQELSWQANYTYSYTRGRNDNFFTPGGAAAGDAPAWPETKYEIQFLNSLIRYKISEQVSIFGEYRFEKYFVQDFTIDNLAPQIVGASNQGVRSVFLAGLQPDYEGHLFGLKLAYQF